MQKITKRFLKSEAITVRPAHSHGEIIGVRIYDNGSRVPPGMFFLSQFEPEALAYLKETGIFEWKPRDHQKENNARRKSAV